MSNKNGKCPSRRICLFKEAGAFCRFGLLLVLVLFAAGCNLKGSAESDPAYQEVWPESPVLRRLTPSQILESVRMLLGDTAGSELAEEGSLPKAAKLHGLSVLAGAELAYTPTDIEKIEFGLRGALESGYSEYKNKFTCIADSPGSECLTSVIREIAEVAWRRPLLDTELAKLTTLAEGAGSTFDVKVKAGLLAIFASPKFLYLFEFGGNENEQDGSRPLTNRELVTRMALFLQGRIPDPEALQEADTIESGDTRAWRDLARRMLTASSARRTLTAYFIELLNLDVDLIAKDNFLFPGFAPVAPYIIEEVKRNLEYSIWEAEDFREFLLSDSTFVNTRLAFYYGVTKSTDDEWERVKLPAAESRAGFFAGTGFLARNSHAGLNSPTRRGHAVMAKFMCLEVPPPPQDVVTTLPPVPPGVKQTLRQRLEYHMDNDNCRGCHRVMDRIGFVLESYNAGGVYRTVDESGLPIDPVVNIPGLGKVKNSRQLARKVTASDEFAKCIPKNLMKQATGNRRLPLLFEGVRLGKKFKASGFDLKALLVEIAVSNSFRNVKTPAAGEGEL